MKTFYKIISILFQPILLPTYGMLLMMQIPLFANNFPFYWKAYAVGGTFLFTGLLPAIPVLIMYFKKQISNLFISNREERTLPYLFSFLAYLFWGLFLLRTMRLPLFIASVGFGSALSIIIITFINTKWKISAHLTSMGGFTGGVFGICYRFALNPVWLFVVVLFVSCLSAIARIGVKAHTPMQTLAGFVVGFLCTFIPVMILK
ncbi:MAG TPA: hypothetical protein P5071_02260 [Paludibacteraceae bacterium]|nr:hypothetical protein [Paludibacteraceae bacterium]